MRFAVPSPGFSAHRLPLHEFVQLVKPGIVIGNLFSFTGAYFLAAMGGAEPGRFLLTALGIALVMASGCAANNLIDRDIDRRMERTRRRGLVTGVIRPANALAVAALLGIAGVALLAVYGGALSAGVALLGYVNYVVVYSLYWKRRSIHGTLVGTLSGATAPVVGYCAASGRLDGEALLLLLIFCLWQMPHAYAIAIARLPDYARAAIPVLPARRGIATTRRHMLAYMALFLAAALALPLLHYVGWCYGAVIAICGALWLRLAGSRRHAGDDRAWARGVFAFSLLVVLALSLMMAVDYRLPAGSDAVAMALRPPG